VFPALILGMASGESCCCKHGLTETQCLGAREGALGAGSGVSRCRTEMAPTVYPYTMCLLFEGVGQYVDNVFTV